LVLARWRHLRTSGALARRALSTGDDASTTTDDASMTTDDASRSPQTEAGGGAQLVHELAGEPGRLVGAPVLVAGGWWMVLRTVPASGAQVVELGLPLAGWAEVLRRAPSSPEAMAWTALLLVAVGLGLVAVRRCAEPPWRWALITQLGFLSLLGPEVLGPNLNGARSTAPLVVLSLIVLASPRRRMPRLVPSRPAPLVGVDPVRARGADLHS
jgi:hypothetical protein